MEWWRVVLGFGVMIICAIVFWVSVHWLGHILEGVYAWADNQIAIKEERDPQAKEPR